jgi:hypothetical protein
VLRRFNAEKILVDPVTRRFNVAKILIDLAWMIGLADLAIGLVDAVRDSPGRRELCIITEVLNEY